MTFGLCDFCWQDSATEGVSIPSFEVYYLCFDCRQQLNTYFLAERSTLKLRMTQKLKEIKDERSEENTKLASRNETI